MCSIGIFHFNYFRMIIFFFAFKVFVEMYLNWLPGVVYDMMFSLTDKNVPLVERNSSFSSEEQTLYA